MIRNFLLRIFFTACFFAPALFASTINVPAGQPTIQAAINAASNGDIILVAPGTYTENINFLGKAITVESSKGAKVTIINGGEVASVVTFSSNETPTSVLKGFTLTNGSATITGDYQGGGIAIDNASPTIEDNIIEDNFAEDAGGGIGINFGSPKSLSFGKQAIGSSTSKTLKLTNAQNKALNISLFSAPTNYSVTGCGASVPAFTSCTLTVTFQPVTAGTFKRNLTVTDDAGSSPQTVPLSGIGR
jgi:hypothetical protein